MVNEAEEAYIKAMAAFENAYVDANGVGTDISNGVADGMTSQEGFLRQKAHGMVTSIIAAMRQAADSHSPSRKTMALGEDMGEGTQIGLEETTKDVANSAKNMVNESLKAMSAYKPATFGATAVNSTLSAASYSTPSNNITLPQTTALLNAIGSKLGNSNTPIIIEVDGKAFAETAIKTINANTKQTGRLALTF